MKNDEQSLESVLCPEFGLGSWEIRISMNPPMKMKLRFLKTGNLIGDLFSWNHIPQQTIAGNWQVTGNVLYINYTYNIPNPNFFGQIVNWIPSTQNVTLNVNSFSSNKINAIQIANIGYQSNYHWLFSR